MTQAVDEVILGAAARAIGEAAAIRRIPEFQLSDIG